MNLKRISQAAAVLCLSAFVVCLFASCAAPTVTPDGYVMSSYKDVETGRDFSVGVAFGEDGKADRVATQWVTDEGVTIMAIRYVKLRTTEFRYRDEQGIWVKWTEASGVRIGVEPTVPPLVGGELEPLTVQSSPVK